MSDKPEDPNKVASIPRFVNSLFWAGLAIAILLTLMMSIAGALHWLSWKIFFYTIVQILLGLVMCSAVILFAFPRLPLFFKKTSSAKRLTNINLTLLGVAFIAFLMALLSTLWTSPEMNFLEKFLSNLGFMSGMAISSRIYLVRNNLH